MYDQHSVNAIDIEYKIIYYNIILYLNNPMRLCLLLLVSCGGLNKTCTSISDF